MKVYVITAGDYSDYHIEAIFTDLEQATAFKDVFNKSHSYDSAKVEVYETDTIHVEKGFAAYSIQFDEEGAVTKIEKDPYSNNFNTFECNRVCVMARDIEHALKIAYDLWAVKSAEKEGIV